LPLKTILEHTHPRVFDLNHAFPPQWIAGNVRFTFETDMDQHDRDVRFVPTYAVQQ
jgi:hypothetical protein